MEVTDINNISKNWLKSSEKDYKTMLHLYKSKDYNWALFIGHITIEKLLKSIVVLSTNNHAPYTHDLVKLASLTKLTFTEEYLDWLDTITTFNINTIYDIYKKAFYKKCDNEFTKEWINKIKTLTKWIKSKQ